MDFNKRLKEEISYKGFTLQELSDLTGVSKRTIGSYVDSRESVPPVDVAYRLAKALDVSVEYLVTGEDKYISKEEGDYRKFRILNSKLLLLNESDVDVIDATINAFIKLKKK